MTKKFKRLLVPETWEQYWTRYPEGYTIMEALINWVSHVNEVSENINDLNEYMDKFKTEFDTNIANTITHFLEIWKEDGTLDRIINDVAYQEFNEQLQQLNEMVDMLDISIPFVNVLTYGADPSGQRGTAAEIQQALDDIGAKGGGVVRIPGGVYRIDKMLVIPANTTIEMDKDTILLRSHSGNFMTNGNAEEHGNVTGYNGNSNITIIGGVFDNNINENDIYPTTANNMIIFGHCQNITIKDATFLDTISYHAIDLNGVKNVNITNCKFLGYTNLLDGSQPPREAIQIAEANMTEFGVNDFTPCHNVTIDGCTFDKSHRTGYFEVAIGNHYSRHGVYQEKITISNNEIIGCSYAAIRPFKWGKTDIINNLIRDCETGVLISNVGANTESSKYPNGSQSGLPSASRNIRVDGNTMLNIQQNAVTTAGQYHDGVLAQPKNITITNNTIIDCGNSAISMTLASNISLLNNFIERAYRGLWFNSSEKLRFNNNVVISSEREHVYANSNNTNSSSKNIQINNNSFIGTDYNGLFIQDCGNISVNNNTLEDCGKDPRGGIFVERSHNGSLTSNTVTNINNTFGLVVKSDCSGIFVSNTFGNREVTVAGDENGLGIMGVDANGIPTIITFETQ